MRVAGCPLHPALVHYPIAAWTVALVADVAVLAATPEPWTTVAWWALATGCVTGLVAMTAGLVDYATIDERSPAEDTALRHLLLMAGAWTVLTLDWIGRDLVAADLPAVRAALTAAGFALLVAGGHQGARLVYHHGVGHTPADD